MNLEYLDEFLRIAELHSITAAAKEINLSVATLSARMKGLERSLDATLLRKRGRSIELTDAGQCLVSNAEDIIRRYHLLTDDLTHFQEHQYRSLRIVIADPGFPLHLGPFLDKINLTNPDVILELSDCRGKSPAECLLSGKKDLWFGTRMDETLPDGLCSSQFAASTHYVVLPIWHRLSRRGSIQLSELTGETFLILDNNTNPETRKFQLRNLEASGMEWHRYDSITDQQCIHFLVPIGKGVLLTPYPLTDLPNSIQLPVTGIPFPASPQVLYRETETNSDVIFFLRDYFAFARATVGPQPYWREKDK